MVCRLWTVFQFSRKYTPCGWITTSFLICQVSCYVNPVPRSHRFADYLLCFMHVLAELVTDLAVKCPSLKELSLIRNPACPGFTSFTKNEERENRKYRLYAIAHLPNLKTLDCSPVTAKDRDISLRLENERPKRLVDHRLTEESAARVAAASAPKRGTKVPAVCPYRHIVQTLTTFWVQVYDGGKKTPLTVVEKKYYRSGESGPSEGNRFIGNADLWRPGTSERIHVNRKPRPVGCL